MEFEKLAAQIKLEIAKLDTTPELDKINKAFDEKIRKVEEARREKLATVPDNNVERKKLIAALEALGEKYVEPTKKKSKE
jgi:adenylosuccinate lyase